MIKKKRKVSDVIEEINNLNNFYDRIHKLLKFMDSNKELAMEFVRETGLTTQAIRELGSYLMVRRSQIEHQLNDCMVDM